MLIKKPADVRPSDITPKDVYRRRREFLKATAALGLGVGLGLSYPASAALSRGPGKQTTIDGIVDSGIGKDLELTSYEHVTSYNNFYEFGTGKTDPAEYAHTLEPRPWSVMVDGECDAPGPINIEDVMKDFTQEERIYRLRCVEAWAAVIPWVGFPLGDLLKRFKPNSKAKYVAFETLYDPEQMPGQRRAVLDWPYREGLRMDEAMHPLTLIATGLYGEELPNQNGAPLRLVVPWKYGFKSIKSIVRITFTETLPDTTWWQMAPQEYGFYANVNPQVDHPRWSQARHRVLGDDLFAGKHDTLMFNGYADQVADLYRGMDLTRFY